MSSSIELPNFQLAKKAGLLEKKARAKKLYFESFMDSREIARRVEVNYNTILLWVYGRRLKNNSSRKDVPIEQTWKYQRDALKDQVLQEFHEAKEEGHRTIQNYSIELIAGALMSRKKKKDPKTGMLKPVDLNEAMTVSKILQAMNEVNRLDNNQPTQIIQQQFKPPTKEELQQAMQIDPFIDITPEEDPHEKLEAKLEQKAGT